MLWVFTVDISKSASEHRGWIVESIKSVSSRCEGTLYSLVVYSGRALPLIEVSPSPMKVIHYLESVESLPGVPEPVRGVVEAAEIVNHYTSGRSAESRIVLYWSMPKKPRLPVKLAPTIASSVGSDLSIVALQYTTPKWARKHDLGPQEIYIYKRRMRPSDLPRRLGCT